MLYFIIFVFHENAGLADFADQNRKLLSMMNAVFLSLVRLESYLIEYGSFSSFSFLFYFILFL